MDEWTIIHYRKIEYEKQGNVCYEKRTLVVPQKGLATFETVWEYDSYGKLVRMTYPGDERVTYHYNATGDLDRVYRGKEDAGRDYVSSIGYDRFGDRVRVAYGNGTDMRYSYNNRTRRLTTATSHLNGVTRASRNYLYDKVGNVYRISGATPVSYTYYYDYDDLYRLVSCTQRYGSGNAVATDTLAMAYDDLWRVTSKSQRLAQKGLMFPGTLNTSYDMDYTYGTASGTHYQLKDVAETSYRTSATPTLADNILSTYSYSYDPNGNLAHESVARRRIDDSTTRQISERKLLWDGQNRLRAISEDGYVSLYCYDGDGNRTLKEHGGGEAVWVNSAPAVQRTDAVACTIYPSPYISVTGDQWTKHYYIGGERIASRTGTLSGGFASLHNTNNKPAGNGIVTSGNYSTMCQAEEDTIDSIYSHFGVPYEALHTSARDGGWHLYMPITRSGRTGDKEDASDTADTAQDRSHPHLDGDSQVFYYHRDHLGSTMSVTDSLCNIVQQVEYTPWGEVFVERRFGGSTFTTPYLFNGKELDEEAGLYYYGARYYDPKMSVWYSVDRFAEKIPFATPYNYTLCNPLKYIDLHGDTTIWATDINSFITRIRVNSLRERSMVFNTLYNILDSSPCTYYLSADDRKVQKEYRRISNWDKGRARAYAEGNKVVFSEIDALETTFSEELFHLYQKRIYGNSRYTYELDAEAKLFNSVVLTEIENTSNSLSVIDAITNTIKNDDPSSFLYERGCLVTTLEEIANTRMQVRNNTNGAKNYFNYVKAFEEYHSQTNGDVYNGKQRYLLPDAYNKIIGGVK